MRRLLKSRSAKVVSWFVVFAFVFTFLPAKESLADALTKGLKRWQLERQGRSRRLTLAEMRVLKGGQGPIEPSDSTMSGAPESWEGSDPASPFSAVNVGSGNLFTSVPVTGFAGRGLDVGLTLHHNSSDLNATAPLSAGWTHSYNVTLTESQPGGGDVTVREGTGRKHTFLRNADGSYTHPPGVFETLVRHADGTYTLTRPNQVQLNFDSQNRLSTIVDPNNNTVTLSYNGQGQLTTVTEPSGKTLTLTYDGSGRIASVTNPLNQTTTFTYDGVTGYLYTVAYPNNTTLTFTYDVQGRLWSITDPRGNVWEYDYDVDGRIVEAHHPGTGQNALRTYTWLQSGVDVTDQTNKVVGYRKNANGELSQVIIDPSGLALTSSASYDSQHNATSATNPRGYTTTTTYDSNGNALTVTDALNRTVTMTYDARNNLTSVTDAAGHVTQYTYNASDDLTQVTDALNNATTYTYDAYGNRLTMTDPANHTWQWGYDATGNVTSVTNPLNQTSQFTYNALGWRLTETDPLNRTTTYTYNVMGRVTQITHPDNTTRQFAYDAAGNLSSVTDENSATATMAYNARGLQTSVTNPLNQTTSFSYDDAGRMVSSTNARGKTTTYTYDGAGRRTGVTYPDNTTRAVSYNANSRVASTTDGRGNVVNYVYDAADQLTTMDYPTGMDVTYSYNADGLRVSMTDGTGTTNWTHDALHRPISESTSRGNVQYTYTTDGNRATMTLVGTGATTYTWNAAHRLTALTNPYSETTSFTYNADGRLNQVTNPNGTTTAYTYTTRGFVYDITHRRSDNSLLSGFRYDYDATGNRLRETELVGNRYSDYFYDNAAQLTRFTERQIVGAQDPRGQYSDDTAIQDDSYAYDAVGNRLSLTDNIGSSQILYTYDDFNKMLTAGSRSFTYDADGNCTSESLQGGGTTRTYSWGYNNELLQITYGGGGTNTFTYDGLGRRVTKADSSGSYSFVYDGDRILSDGQAVYTRAGGSRLISERRGNNSKWHHSDGLTSTRTLTNNTQTSTDTFRYDAWGDIAERTGNTPTPHQFVGALGYEREADSGFYFIGTRYYDPSTGRFLSQDPAQAGVNWYLYAANNPVSAFEREGLWWETLLDIAGLVLDVKDFIDDPSWENAGWIAGDVVSIILPTPTPSLIKHGGKLLKHGDDVVKRGDDVVDTGRHIIDDVCFIAGTLIHTKEGLKPIEEIQAGDWVRSKDEQTGAVSYQQVARTFQHTTRQTVTVQAGKEKIHTTPEHPFYVDGKGWVRAGSLQVGDALLTPDDVPLVIRTVKVEAVRGPPVVVYNLEVAGTHTYFVGRSGVWVHNKPPTGGKPPKKKTRKTEKEKATDAPSWSRGKRPKPGESVEDFLKRIFEEQYGEDYKIPKGPNTEYSKIKKHIERT